MSSKIGSILLAIGDYGSGNRDPSVTYQLKKKKLLLGEKHSAPTHDLIRYSYL